MCLANTQIPGNNQMISGNDMKAAEASYGGFLTMLKFGMVAVAIITIIVIALIA